MRLRPRLALTTVAVSVPMLLGLVWWDVRARRSAAEDELIEFTQGLASRPDWIARCEASASSWRGGRPARRQGAPKPPGEWREGPTGARSQYVAPPPPPPDRGPPPGDPPSDDAPRADGPLPGDGPLGDSPGDPRRGDPRPGDAPPERRSTRPAPHRLPATFFAYGSDFRSAHPEAPALPPAVQAEMRQREAVAVTEPWSSGLVQVVVRSPQPSDTCTFILAEGTTEPWLGAILPATPLWLLPVLAVFGAVLLAAGPMVHRFHRLTALVRRSADSDYESGVLVTGNDEIAELARAFDEAARSVRTKLAETRRNEDALREFLANTTHDVMIPLTVLQGHLAELRQRGGDGTLDETLGRAMDEAHYLGALIHNLAIAAKLDAAVPVLQMGAVDLGALVERVVSRHRPIARGRNVSIDRAVPSAPLEIRADVTMLEQAVGNLVYNAVRYNQSGGHVAVILEHDAARGFVIHVIDDGPGIPEDRLAQAVERGFRGDQARTRAPDGHGLGLHITHRVAALHGFRLELKRSEYGGLEADVLGALEPASSA